MKIKREDLLARLRLVEPGLMVKGIVEQGNCFVFRNSEVITFNEEVCCRTQTDLPSEFEGAVVAPPLVNYLDKMDEDEIKILFKKEKLQIFGNKKGAQFNLQKSITLPVESVTMPDKWKRLPDQFTDALALVQECTSSKKTIYALTCVHIHPKWIEATDRFQIARFNLDMPVEESLLIPKDSIKHVVPLEVYSVGTSLGWCHFRTKDKETTISCRASKEAFKDYSPFLKDATGKHATLPKGLEDAANRASVFASENPNVKLLMEIRKDRVRVRGIGITGESFEDEEADFKGSQFKFLVSPKLLIELVQKHTECCLSDKHLRVEVGNFVWVAGIGKVEEE